MARPFWGGKFILTRGWKATLEMPPADGEYVQEHPRLRLSSALPGPETRAGLCWELFQTDRHLAEASLPTRRTRWGD